MSKTLYPYYERELLFIRQLAQDFARRYPAAAGRLLLEANRSTDPHIERLIESFALLAGRIHHKLDDEFPELTEALLNVLYPHYLAPIPSMAIVEFEVDASRGPLPNGFQIERNNRLHAPMVGDVACKFRTAYPVTLWPISLTSAEMLPPPFPPGLRPPPQTASALILRLQCLAGQKFSNLTLDHLRFFLHGENHAMAGLYELLFNHALQVQFRPGEPDSRQAPIVMASEKCLSQVGFETDEGIIPYPRRSFPGYRLLTEFFTFPSKFLFIDIGGFDRVRQADFQGKLEIIIFLNRSVPSLQQAVDSQTFRLGCCPVVNLFEQIAEPIALDQTRFEYRVVPDVARPMGLEVYSVNSVTSVNPATSRTTEYHPFYSFRHGLTRDNQDLFWYASRRLSPREGDRGTEVFLNLVDLGFQPRLPAESTLVVRTTCTNRNVPGQLQHAGEQLALTLEAAAPLTRVRCLRAPTMPLRPPLRQGAHWRLLSHLSLNHLSLTDGEEGREALQEILRLYDFSDPESGGEQQAAITRQLIDGIAGLSSRRVVGRAGSSSAGGFCRGVEVTLDFDEQKYVGTGVFLFACVLERFLGLYASINSFSQLVARTKQSQGYFKKWPPRAGELPLL